MQLTLNGSPVSPTSVDASTGCPFLEIQTMTEKRCPKCGEVKPLDGFNRNKSKKDGLQVHCRQCTCAYKRNRRMTAGARVQALQCAASRRHAQKHGKRQRTYLPGKTKAWSALNRALRRGKLTRPDACDWCHDDTHRVEAHHDDYTKPLDVTWLCSPCHNRLHHALRYPLLRLSEAFSIEGVLNA